MSVINAVIKSIPSASNSLVGDWADSRDDSFAKALDKATAAKEELEAKASRRRGLSGRSWAERAFSFKKAFQSPREVNRSLDLAQAALPASLRKKLGLGLMAMGGEGSSIYSMTAGAGLSGCSTSGEALKGIFSSLGTERSFLKMDKKALPALAEILAGSGLDEESINAFLDDLNKNGLSVDQLFYGLSKLNLEQGQGGGLRATEDGLSALGQFFGSLGASPEIVDLITSGFKSGEEVTAAALRGIIGSGDDGNLAPGLTEADAYNLANLLRSMGAGQKHLNSLSNLLAESRGHLSINDFLDFIESMENAPAKTLDTQDLNQIQTVLNNLSREQQLVKTPVFDEILTKIQMLGDREIDDKFMKLSPALQALRGGLSGQTQNTAFGGQSGQNGQGSPQDRREDKEQFRHLMNASVSGREGLQASAVETAEAFMSYGGQESLARQISQKMLYSHRRGINRLKMKLNPENLGRLDIELRVKGDQLVAHIRAENEEAYQALAADIDSLKEALAQGGLMIDNLTVAYDDGQGGDLQFADLEGFGAVTGEAAVYDRNNSAPDGSVYRVI